MSLAGGPKDRRRTFEKELLGQLWKGDVDAAIQLLRAALERVRNPASVEELIGYLDSSSTPYCSNCSISKDLTHQLGGVAPGAVSPPGVGATS